MRANNRYLIWSRSTFIRLSLYTILVILEAHALRGAAAAVRNGLADVSCQRIIAVPKYEPINHAQGCRQRKAIVTPGRNM